jgi:hypothetical protein
MDFPNVKLLGYTHSNNFLGEKNFRYSSVATLTINGYILDLVETSGVKTVIEACENLSSALGSNQSIMINGNSYGEGRITNISFDSGNWVRVTEYTATIEIFKKASLFAFSDAAFNGGVVGSLGDISQYVEDFSENYSLDYDSNGDFLNGSQSINLSFSSLFAGDRVSAAKALAVSLFANSKAIDLVHDPLGAPASDLKEFFSETYNLIDGSCSFTRNFSHPNNSNCYSEKRSTSFDFGEDGIVTVTESSTIKGECGDGDAIFNNALSRFNSVIGSAYSRCSSVFSSYKTKGGITIEKDLIDKVVQKTVKKNRFSGVIEYSVSFNNDPANEDECVTEKVLEVSRSEDFIWTVSARGSFIGVGKIGSVEKFNSAFACWTAYSGSVEGDASVFYSSNVSNPRALNLITKGNTSEPYKGVVSYDYSFTDDPSINMSSPVRRKILTVTEGFATQIHNDFLIPGGSKRYAVAQLAGQATQGTRRVEGSLECSSPTLPFCGFDYYTSAESDANAKKGSGTDLYLESFSFSSDEIEQTVNFSAEYKYSTATTV